MAYRSITSVCRADRILKRGLFTGNFNIMAQPKRLEMQKFFSQLAHPLKGLAKPLGPKEGSKGAALNGIGADPKSTALSGGRDGPEQDEEKSRGGRSSGAKHKRQMGFVIGAAGILGVPLQEITDDDNEKACEKQSAPAESDELVDEANSTDPQIDCDAVKSLLLFRDPKSRVDTLISSNVLPALVNGLSSPNTAHQFEAALALTIIANGTSEQTQAVVEAGAVPQFLKLLTSPNQMIREVAAVMLFNIISDGPKLRDYVINLRVVAPLLNLIQSDIPLTLLHKVVLVFAKICHYKDPLPRETLQEILSALNILIRHDDTEVLVYTVWALWQLTDNGNEHIQMVIDSGVLPKLVQLLSHLEVEVLKSAVRAIGNIVAGTDQSQAVLNCGALSHLHNLLNHPDEDICKVAMSILSIVTFGNVARVQAVIDAGFAPLIIAHLEKEEVHTKVAAALAVISMTASGNADQVAHLIDCGLIPSLYNLLNDKDSEATKVILGILMKSVKQDEGGARTGTEESGGVEKIQLQRNLENKEIGMISCDIIENSVSEGVEEDSNLVPEVAGNARQYNPIKMT